MNREVFDIVAPQSIMNQQRIRITVRIEKKGTIISIDTRQLKNLTASTTIRTVNNDELIMPSPELMQTLCISQDLIVRLYRGLQECQPYSIDLVNGQACILCFDM